MANNNKGNDQVVSNVKKSDVMEPVRAGLTAIRGMGATPEAVKKMTSVMRAAGVKFDPVKNRAVVGGFNVTGFQNVLYVCNARKGWGFTDAELAVAWTVCLPGNNPAIAKGAGFVSDPGKYVGGTRTLYNASKHGPLPTGYVFVKSERFFGNTPKPTTQKSAPQPTEAPVQPPVVEPVAAVA